MMRRIKKILIGNARSISDPSLFYRLSLIAFFAWVGLGADGITSSCYGPEEAFLALGQHTYLSIFVALGTVLTIFIISASYHQIIELFPHGGGGYLVASKLLSPAVGMVSGCALLIDYLLTITLSVASGADALFSFLPASVSQYKLAVAIAGVTILIWLNLRDHVCIHDAYLKRPADYTGHRTRSGCHARRARHRGDDHADAARLQHGCGNLHRD